mmetsp:Transcript_54939/g.145027  ORF Transcript_54939/g.145027 Transcript_54939/m.145027 type:complete len:257 (-) Transcript_54939:187-957(-)
MTHASSCPVLRFGSPFTRTANIHPSSADSLQDANGFAGLISPLCREGQLSPYSSPPQSPCASFNTGGVESHIPVETQNVVIWQGANEDASWDTCDESSGVKSSSNGPAFGRRLGQVHYSVRDGKRPSSGYSVRVARIADDGMLVPVPDLASSPRRHLTDTQGCEILNDTTSSMTLHNWLAAVRRDSSRKAPLPRDWATLPLERLVQLAAERGYQCTEPAPDAHEEKEQSKHSHSQSHSRIAIVKFLRNWHRAHGPP